MILDSGKTLSGTQPQNHLFESVVILDSGKTVHRHSRRRPQFESVVILDRFSKRRQNLWRFLPPFFCIPRAFSVLDPGKRVCYTDCIRSVWPL